jgi:hypothetical protein
MSEQTDKYHRNAKEARDNAQKCVNDTDRETWPAIEKAWLQLAQEASKKS